jgi:hypothetical protein
MSIANNLFSYNKSIRFDRTPHLKTIWHNNSFHIQRVLRYITGMRKQDTHMPYRHNVSNVEEPTVPLRPLPFLIYS